MEKKIIKYQLEKNWALRSVKRLLKKKGNLDFILKLFIKLIIAVLVFRLLMALKSAEIDFGVIITFILTNILMFDTFCVCLKR